MAEALYNASGLGLPIVMTVANRAIGAPINIWNDHSRLDVAARLRLDPALRRDQPGGRRPARPGVPARRGALAAGDGLHGRLHPHPRRSSASTLPTQEQVDAFLPPFEPRQVLDPDEPVTIGAMVGPEAFTEVRYLMHAKQMQALDAIPRIAAEFADAVRPRRPAGSLRGYRTEDAETVVVALGSVLGTIEDVVDELRDEGVRDRRARASSASGPWPARRGPRGARAARERVVVLEKAFAVGAGGIVGQNVRLALSGLPTARLRRGRRARRPADHQGVAARDCSTTRAPDRSGR